MSRESFFETLHEEKQPVSDLRIARYLAGELPADEAPEVERLAAANDEVRERVEARAGKLCPTDVDSGPSAVGFVELASF